MVHPLGRSLQRLHRLDTWDGLHVFLTFDTCALSSINTAARYDFVWGAGQWAHPAVDPYHESIVLSWYMTFDRDFSDAVPQLQPGHDLAWFQQNHPDWIIYQADRMTPAWEFSQQNLVPLDISNPEVLDYQVGLVQQLQSSHPAGEVDAMAVDNMTLTNYYGKAGVYRAGQWVTLYNPGADPPDPRWPADVVDWAKQMRIRLHDLDPPLGMIVNLSPVVASGPVEPREVARHVDGVLEEAFGFSTDPSQYGGEADWVARVEMMRFAQERGCAYFKIFQFGPPVPPCNSVDPFDCSPAPAVTPAAIDWSVATYMMGNYGKAALFICGQAQYGCALWNAEYSADVGRPEGHMHLWQNVYRRDYSRAVALVNPSTTNNFTASLPPNHTYTDLRGVPLPAQIPMPAGTGVVAIRN